ncbi:amino acid ABC transporter substrate-binding protein/permease [Isobaculum melis]|uniref:Amino acid ABC transporter substrate-binding protein, PAAT family /amino acid ABC transporter membrane protein, PAAT family n=1 Tax=Isobaculum melis TaxID=142588 RepID=A0A1H9UJD6_9LACT|nr:amino acid ABC transporter substrate-binding protein/permease [Isobaculum melis]SES09257.1 amino acid ABC transporter substrate-binding protein, PAAT family /amino acid ABC transporter membrane protein, PAAT family [Isobaculum melis]
MKKQALTKLSFIFALLSLAFILNACSQKKETTGTSDDRKYIIATDTTFAPFEFEDTNGEFVGIDMDLLNAIAEDQGFTFEIKPLGFNAAVQALESNQVDGVIAGMSITDERKEKFDFSDAYFDSGVVMAVSEKEKNISSYADLKGKNVAIKTGTEGATFANSIKDKYGFTTTTFDDSSNMYEEVKSGNAVATFEDYPVIAYGINQGNGLKLATEKEAGGQYGFAVNQGENEALIKMFNEGLQHLKDSGQYQEIVDKYLATPESKASETGFIGLIKENYKKLLDGLGKTLLITLVSILLAAIIGILFGLLSVAPNRGLKVIATLYVDLMRGLPLIVLAFFIYFGIPSLTGIRLSATIAGITTLSLNAGAYIAEIVRGGINAVDNGQLEAARSLGLPYGKAMQKVILPQAIRMMIPSFINQFVITLKDTSILSVIGLVELTQTGKIIIARNLQSFDMWLIIGLIYIIVITILTKISKQLERRIQNG